MQYEVILKGIEEIGYLFHNRSMFSIGIESIEAKDYPVEYEPIKIFSVDIKKQKYILKIIENINDTDISEIKKKWIKTVDNGAIRALYRANLEEFNLDADSEIPTEKDILWESLFEGEATIIPDTSSLMDGLILRLVESEKFDEKWDLNICLSPTVIKELQNHAMGRQKQFDEEKIDKSKREAPLIKFAEEKRKSRIALRALSELVEYRKLKELRIKIIDTKQQDGTVDDWNILLEAKSIQVDTPKFFITNDLIQSTLASLMGLKTKYMSPAHLFSKDSIKLKNKNEVGKVIYELAIQYGEIILKTKNGEIEFTLQSDWSNKMSPSWTDKTLIMKIESKKIEYINEIISTINRKRVYSEKIKDLDPRRKLL